MSRVIVPRRSLILPSRFRQKQGGFIMNPYAHGGSADDGISFANVRLLLHGDGADGATSITDSSSYARTMTRVGTSEIDTAQSVFGGSSLYIPASTSGWTCVSDANLDMRTGAFQLDWRHRLAANLTSTSQFDTVLAMVNGDTWFYEWAIGLDRNYIRFYYGRRGITSGGIRWLLPGGYDFGTLGGVQVACSIARDTSGKWGAWVDGNRCTQYQTAAQSGSPAWGGVTTGTLTDGTDFGSSGTRTLNVGRFWTFSGLAVDKHIDELRYVTGQSRDVTSDYTPLASAFPNS